MSYIKIFSPIELDKRVFHMLQFDYKRTDPDSVFYPNATYEYFYEHEEDEEAYNEFCTNVKCIHALLQENGIDYDYEHFNIQIH